MNKGKINKRTILITIILFVVLFSILALQLNTKYKPLNPEEFRQRCEKVDWNVSDYTLNFLTQKTNSASSLSSVMVANKTPDIRLEYYNCDSFMGALDIFNFYLDNKITNAYKVVTNFNNVGKYTFCRAINPANNMFTYIICSDTNFLYTTCATDNAEQIEDLLNELGFI